jgi:hypothetical protein
MKPGSREEVPRISEAVRDATAICDPEGSETAVFALMEAFEDDDRPATASEDLRGELLSTVRAIDPEGEDPAAWVAAATAVWLATNPGQRESGDHAIREGVRLVFEGEPPPPVGDWLAARGVAA